MGSYSYPYSTTSASQGTYHNYPQQHYYQSQPLARYGSSGGSSQASSMPDSPTMSDRYYSHHSPRYDEQPMFNEVIYEDQSSQAGPSSRRQDSPRHQQEADQNRDWPVYCLYPDCNARPFKRSADLHRHYKNIHAPETAKEMHYCDYPRCVRSSEPFHRRDHFRDHLREYHKEDIQKRGVSINKEWIEGRYTSSNWWRCPRCLVRAYVADHGYDCPKCKTSCESVRKEKREKEEPKKKSKRRRDV